MTTERPTTDPHPADERPLLEIDHLSVDFRLESSVVHAVQDVSLHVRAGETLAVVGSPAVARAPPRSPCCASTRARRASTPAARSASTAATC
ncbi:hypothetical protein OIM90_00280 [Streptomyces sp. AD16]|nr:hypothetical protein OIM90_00280 [Streptomyces sp. AD16]